MLWIPSTNMARVTHENAFQLCAQKINQLSVSDFFKDCEPNCLFPEDPGLSLQLTHLLSVSYFSASQGVFLDLGWFAQHLWASDLLSPSGDALQSWGQCTEQGPSWQKGTLGLSSKFRNGHSGRKHIDKWQQCTNEEPGPSPEWASSSSRAGSALLVLTEMWSFAPWDLASSGQIFYRKIQFYCTVNIIWQLRVKVSSLIALSETKSSQIHT